MNDHAQKFVDSIADDLETMKGIMYDMVTGKSKYLTDGEGSTLAMAEYNYATGKKVLFIVGMGGHLSNALMRMICAEAAEKGCSLLAAHGPTEGLCRWFRLVGKQSTFTIDDITFCEVATAVNYNAR